MVLGEQPMESLPAGSRNLALIGRLNVNAHCHPWPYPVPCDSKVADVALPTDWTCGASVVTIAGRGPSSNAPVPEDSALIGINTRRDTPYHRFPDYVFAVDAIYRERHYKFPVSIAPLIEWRWPACVVRQTATPPDDCTRFYAAHGGLVYCMCLSGVQALFVALNRTKAPVVLTGFDLSDWAMGQLGIWSVALRMIAREPELAGRVYRHREMKGPLAEMIVEWP